MVYTLGIDVGTSGARACILDVTGQQPPRILRALYDNQPTTPAAWRAAVLDLVARVDVPIASVCVDGTSATTLLVDASTGALLADAPIMYNQAAPPPAVEAARRMSPNTSTALAPTSALPKLLSWVLDSTVDEARAAGHDPVLCHQADWIAGLLMDADVPGRFGISSYNNCLKLGYDVRRLCWPDWLAGDAAVSPLLPRRVAAPGDVVATCFEQRAVVCAGTTDSIAAFVASGAVQPGDAVTSLGSTLALKLLSSHPVEDDPVRGIYCHRLGDMWLVGGASSSGCAVLRERIGGDDVVEELSKLVADWTVPPAVSLGTPLPAGVTHDRFLDTSNGGENAGDGDALPPHDHLYALLHAIALLEARGDAALAEAGASPLRRCWRAGGGAQRGVARHAGGTTRRGGAAA